MNIQIDSTMHNTVHLSYLAIVHPLYNLCNKLWLETSDIDSNRDIMWLHELNAEQ